MCPVFRGVVVATNDIITHGMALFDRKGANKYYYLGIITTITTTTTTTFHDYYADALSIVVMVVVVHFPYLKKVKRSFFSPKRRSYTEYFVLNTE